MLKDKHVKMKTEISLVVIFIIGIFMRLLHILGAGFLITISLIGIAVLYFPFGLYFFSEKGSFKKNIGSSILFGFFISITPIALLYEIQNWDGAELLLMSSILINLILLAITLIYKKKKNQISEFFSVMYVRVITLTIVTILFYLYSLFGNSGAN